MQRRKGGGHTEDIIQNLKDAGYDEDKISNICRLCDEGRTLEAIRVLQRYRCGLMDRLHESQKRVDRLDYLVYQMQKYMKVKEN